MRRKFKKFIGRWAFLNLIAVISIYMRFDMERKAPETFAKVSEQWLGSILISAVDVLIPVFAAVSLFVLGGACYIEIMHKLESDSQ